MVKYSARVTLQQQYITLAILKFFWRGGGEGPARLIVQPCDDDEAKDDRFFNFSK
jgi:hypothetical protein